MGENRMYVEWEYFGLCGRGLFRKYRKVVGPSCSGNIIQRTDWR